MCLNNPLDMIQLLPAQAMVGGQLDLRFQPEFRFSIPRVDMNVHSRLFSGEEEKPITTFTEDRRTHEKTGMCNW